MEFSDYYKKELDMLRQSGKDFAGSHPDLAPLLAGPGLDPDVERLLEGVAFLTSHISRKLDNEFPEILHNLMQAVYPHHMRPFPSATIMAFSPKNNLIEKFTVPAQTPIESKPVNGTACKFRTCYPVDVLPFKMTDAGIFERQGDEAERNHVEVRLEISLSGVTLDTLDFDSLRFHLAGNFNNSSDLYFLLNRYLTEINLKSGGESRGTVLDKSALSPAGFSQTEELFPFPKNVFPGYRLLQEYFIFPERFLFFDLDLSGWKDRGSTDSFVISFICSVPPFAIPEVTSTTVVLFAVPAINLFTNRSEPILLDQQEHEIPVYPASPSPETISVYSIDAASGIERTTGVKRKFNPFPRFSPKQGSTPVYTVSKRPSTGTLPITLFSTAYPPECHIPEAEIVTLELTCSNGGTADLIETGAICRPSTNTPELVEYANITPSTVVIPEVSDNDRLWTLLSHLSVNYLSIADSDSLQAMLRLYIPQGSRDKLKEIINHKRVASISSVTVIPGEHIHRQSVYRGQTIHIKTRHDQFSSIGDMYLFGSVLDNFLSTYAAINSFTALIFENTLQGDRIEWPIRLGTKPLL